MKYFLHDTSAFEDEKIIELHREFGFEGVGLFFVILEKLAKQEKPIKTDILKFQLRIGKKLEKCWQFMEEIGLISSNNGETFNKQLLNFSEKYQIKNQKTAERVSKWREKQSVTENVTRSERDGNAPKVKVSKVKVSNINTSTDVPQTLIPDVEFERFNTWILTNAPLVAKLKEPFTAGQYRKLVQEFRASEIEKALQAMHNWKPLLTKRTSANLTIRAFMKTEKPASGNGSELNFQRIK